MKNIITKSWMSRICKMAFAAALLSFLSLSFISCSDGGGSSGSSGGDGSGTGTSLAGTTWLTNSSESFIDMVGVYFKDDTNFYEASKQSHTFAVAMLGGEYCYYIHFTKSGTYTFDGTTLTLNYGEGTGNMESGSVKIENNRLIFLNSSSMSFTKQSSNPTITTPLHD